MEHITASSTFSSQTNEPTVAGDFVQAGLPAVAPFRGIDAVSRVISHFSVPGQLIHIEPLKMGHINDTFIGSFQQADGSVRRCIHQWINHEVFKDIPGLMSNIARVTEHLRVRSAVQDSPTLTVLPTREGNSFLVDMAGGFWRTFDFIEGTRAVQQATSPRIAFESGRVLARFHSDLADFDAASLSDTIPYFHHATRRFTALRIAVEQDSVGRASSVAEEIAAAFQMREHLEALIESLENGALPLRVTHNDMKLNNILFEKSSERAVCVVDLDTVMQGSLLHDFGDLLRNVAVDAAEDEKDLSRIVIASDLFSAATRGYAETMAPVISEQERCFLHQAPALMGLLLGVRFLTDHLNGDVYFRVHHEGHNLERARAQLTVSEQFHRERDQLSSCVEQLFAGV